MGMMISLDSDNYKCECKGMIAIQSMRSHYWVIYRRSQVPLAESFPTVPLSACIIRCSEHDMSANRGLTEAVKR